VLARIDSNQSFTIDGYDSFAWITLYSNVDISDLIPKLQQEGITSAVKITKSSSDLPTQPEVVFGDVPETLIAEELGCKYEIRCKNTFHAGLFLDHQLTRQWLHEKSKDKTLLNLFSYSGSLTIAAAIGGAKESISIDLSNPATQWAKTNATLNGLNESHQFIKGDVFDWTKRFKKKQRTFDIVISDPPSQSRSEELHFSTKNHLDLLHERCLDCLAPKGVLITSINTETISEKALKASILNTGKKMNRSVRNIEVLALPKGFEPGFRAMKGLRVLFSN
jgi:23S rRNA (cytosine1962-C5)-methyltransferase